MFSLALAHLFHRKLGSVLSVFAVGIGITLLIVMLGLSHGMLNEVADRIQSVDAELIVLPENENVIFTAGAAFSGKIGPIINAFQLDDRPVIKRSIGIMLDTLSMAGQQQRLFGVDPADMPAFMGSRRLLEGRLFDENRAFGNQLDAIRNSEGYYDPTLVADAALNDACQLVIDSRLARVGNYKIGDRLTFLGRSFQIVGIIESGVAGRVFCSLHVLQHIKNGGAPWVSLFFVQLLPPPNGQSAGYEEKIADALSARIKAKVEPKSAYRELMYASFTQVYIYINTASALVLVVCFIFIMLSMHMMVLERTREIGILKSLGATRARLMKQIIIEAVLVCACGTLVGILLAFLAKYGIEAARPLITITLESSFVLIAVLVGILGGTASALYPGWRAAKLCPAKALNAD